MSSGNQDTTILVVDDDTTILQVLRTILTRRHYNVIIAESGIIALEIIKQNPIHLVITDVHMPELSGIDLLTEVRNYFDDIPFIIITGKASVEAAVECMKIGAMDFISKPFSLSKIEDTVCTALAESMRKKTDHDKTTKMRSLQSMISGYNIVGRLGEGNMGIVYLVERKRDRSDRQYALKLFKSTDFSVEENAKLRQRFLNEAEAAASVRHPNIVEFVEYGQDEHNMANYIVMEFVQGVSLKHYLAKPNTLSYRKKCEMLHQMADALSAIHELKICHRDMKPANIMIDNDLAIKITDFGIAKLPDSMLTQKNDLMGSPSYMAPESFVSSQVDHRADIFSLGIMAYELFLGVHPFRADTFLRLCYLIRNETPEPPVNLDPECPPGIQAIILKMLEKDPNHRYPTAGAICDDIGRYLESA